MSTSSMQHTQFLRALQQQLIDQLLGRNSDHGLLASVLQRRRRKSELESIALSLTGRMGSEAGLGRRSIKNAAEGASIARLAEAGLNSVWNDLQKLQSVISGYAERRMAREQAHNAYSSLAAGIQDAIEAAVYDDIELLDGRKWAGDKRLRPGLGGTASLSIQVGPLRRDLVLTDIAGLTAGLLANDLRACNPREPTGQEALFSLEEDLSVLAKSVRMFARSYAAQAAYMEAESRAVRRDRGPDTEMRQGKEGACPAARPLLRLHTVRDCMEGE